MKIVTFTSRNSQHLWVNNVQLLRGNQIVVASQKYLSAEHVETAEKSHELCICSSICSQNHIQTFKEAEGERMVLKCQTS